MANETKDLTTKTIRPPRITWKAVEPRHYQRARDYLDGDGKEAYAAYVLRLVEAWDFTGSSAVSIPVSQPDALSKEQREQVLAAFEAEYGPAQPKEGKE